VTGIHFPCGHQSDRNEVCDTRKEYHHQRRLRAYRYIYEMNQLLIRVTGRFRVHQLDRSICSTSRGSGNKYIYKYTAAAPCVCISYRSEIPAACVHRLPGTDVRGPGQVEFSFFFSRQDVCPYFIKRKTNRSTQTSAKMAQARGLSRERNLANSVLSRSHQTYGRLDRLHPAGRDVLRQNAWRGLVTFVHGAARPRRRWI
jgi:hypothetical protein